MASTIKTIGTLTHQRATGWGRTIGSARSEPMLLPSFTVADFDVTFQFALARLRTFGE